MNEKTRCMVRNLLLACAIGFIGFGACRGEASEVLEKAVQICLSCIGIG